MTRLMMTAAMIMAPLTAFAHDYKVGDLTIIHPVAKAVPESAMTSAGYVDIVNKGDTSDRLIAVTADFPRVQIHDTKFEDGVATMFHVEAVEIGPGETVNLAPGGMHIMFMGLGGEGLFEGDIVPTTMTFEKAGTIAIDFQVEQVKGTHNH